MNLPESGIVTSNYLMAPDGKRYQTFFCQKWRIITDSAVPIKNFHSQAKWLLLGYVGDEIKIVIPGCQIIGFTACVKPPTETEMFMNEGKYTEIPVGLYCISNEVLRKPPEPKKALSPDDITGRKSKPPPGEPKEGIKGL